MKGMSLGEKADYLWTYYRIWLLVPVIAAAALHVMCSAIQAGRENILVSAVVIGAGTNETGAFESGLKQYMNKTGRNDKVVIQTNIVDDRLSPDTTTALTTLVGAAAADVFICPRNVYEHFSRMRAFTDIKEILNDSDGQYDGMALSGKGDALIIRNSGFVQEKLGAPYQEAYVAVLDHPKHEEGKRAFVKYVLENK